MKAGLQGKIVKDEVIKLRSRFTDVHFAWQSGYERKFNQHNFTRVSVNLEWPWIYQSVFVVSLKTRQKYWSWISFSAVFSWFFTASRFFLAPDKIQGSTFKTKMKEELVGNIALVSKVCFFGIIGHEDKSRRGNTDLITIKNLSRPTRFWWRRMLVNN